MRNARYVVCAVLAIAACGDNIPGNHGPSLTDRQVTTLEDTPISVTIAVDDPDSNDEHTFTFTDPEHGTVTADGATITYRPDDDYNGPDQFRVSVDDGTETAEATISITVTALNDAPVAGNDALAANEDTAAVATGAALVANDIDVDGDTLTVTSVGNPSSGTVGQVGDTITFTPANNFTGTATYEYTVTDGMANDVGTVTVTVGGQNDPPVAVDDTATTAEDTNAVMSAATLVANDTDVENQALSVMAVSNATNGTVSLTAGTITFIPTGNFNGTAGFDYTVTDGAATDTGHVTVTVTPANDAPVANAQSVTTNEDAPVTITLTGSDIEGSALTFSVVTSPSAGALGTITQLTPTSATVVYTPTLNSTTDDSFTFRVTDTGTANSAPATVTIDVVPLNDSPVAAAQSVSTDEDTALQITLSATDVDSANLTFAIGTGPATGTLSTITQLTPTTARVTYTPNLNSTAADSFTFVANDGNSNSAPATISITVNALDDRPIANAQSVSTDEDMAVQITLTGSDVEGASLTFAIGTNPSTGTLGTITQLTPTSARVTYTPNLNATASDSFTFTATGGGQTSLPATVGITVNPLNDGPVAVNDPDTAQKDTPMVRETSVYLANDTDVDGPSLSITAVGPATNGTVGLVGTTITFTPTPGYTGAASFPYTLSDTLLTTTGTVNITVLETNTPIDAQNDTDSTNEDVALVQPAVTYTANDIDPDPQTRTVTSVQTPVNGTVGLAAGFITFTPTADFNGTGSFTYTVTDGIASDTATVTVTINSVNDLPVANNDAATVNEDSALNVIDVLTNDVLGNNPAIGDQPVSVSIATPATNGAAFVNASNQVVFTPSGNFAGSDSLAYRITDGDGSQTTATVNITVTNLNDPPTANGAAVSVNENATSPITLTGSDIDLPAQTLTFVIATPPSNGILGPIVPTSPTTANIAYAPNTNYVGPDSFTFTVNDGVVTSAPATISITVNNVVVCNDGVIDDPPEKCDDGGNGSGDGCSPTCLIEAGWTCTGAPSNCDPICGDGVVIAGNEECDDMNGVETDGCTTQCQIGPACTTGIYTGSERVTTDPASGHCYASFDTDQVTWSNAHAACVSMAGHLASITSLEEQGVVVSVQNPLQNPWIGATDAVVEGSFGWITGEPFTFNGFIPPQPDGGDPEDCVNLFSTALAPGGLTGAWNDTNCDFIGFTAGYVCEFETRPCGDGIQQLALSEQCDDGNTNAFDGCSATCTVEAGAVCTGAAPTTCAKLIINEVDYDQVGTDGAEFIEIYNAGTAPATLASFSFVLMNGNVTTNVEYFGFGQATRIQLAQAVNSVGTAQTALAPGAYLVIAPTGTTVPASALRILGGTTNLVQNGPSDAIALLNNSTTQLADALSYEGDVSAGVISGGIGARDFREGGTGLSVAQVGGEGADGTSAGSLRRVINGRDTNVTTADWVFNATSSMGVANP